MWDLAGVSIRVLTASPCLTGGTSTEWKGGLQKLGIIAPVPTAHCVRNKAHDPVAASSWR